MLNTTGKQARVTRHIPITVLLDISQSMQMAVLSNQDDALTCTKFFYQLCPPNDNRFQESR